MNNKTLLVVLGCRLRPNGAPSEELKLRVGAACAAFQRRTGSVRILLAGGGTLPVKEATVMQDVAEKLGVSREHIVLEPNGNSTLEHAVFTQHHTTAQTSRIVVITSLYHIDRAKYVFEKVFEDLLVEVAGVKVEAVSEAVLRREKQLLGNLQLFETILER